MQDVINNCASRRIPDPSMFRHSNGSQLLQNPHLQNSFFVTSVADESFRRDSTMALRTRGGKRGSDAILLSSGSVLMASAN